MAKKIDFAAINRAALRQFQALLSGWLPGGEVSNGEYRALNPNRSDSRKGSFSINIHKGVWSDFATGDAGSDPVSLYAYLFHADDQGVAAKELADSLGLSDSIKIPSRGPEVKAAKQRAKALPAEKLKDQSPWVPIFPPANVPEHPKAHPVRGLPSAVWTYRSVNGALLGFIYRFVTSTGGKEICPLTWCEHSVSKKQEWRWMQWSEPRPLYGLDRLATKDVGAAVLITEGEKCADVAAEQLAGFVSLTWSGGGKAIAKADFSPLAGRRVIIWPDCDAQREKLSKEEVAACVDPKSKPLLPEAKQPGMVAAVKVADSLLALGCKVWLVEIPKPGEKPGGWDIADAVAEGLVGDELEAWIRKRCKPYGLQEKPAKTGPAPITASAGGGNPADSEVRHSGAWFDALAKKARGGIEPVRSNIAKILRLHPEFRGKLGYNEFAHQVEKLGPLPWSDELGGWENDDDAALDEWLADEIDVLVKSLGTIAEGVTHAANANKYHPVRNWLDTLPEWDGVARLDTFLAELTGNEPSTYLSLAGRFFLMAMVARIYKPGVKFDYMLVLEGKQGMGKSSFFRELSQPWFNETPFEIGTNEGNMAIQGVWLQEMPEMGMFSKAEDTAFKSFLAITQDKFRRPYDRRPVEAARVCLFGGTTNLTQYLKDHTGNRRIWPVFCNSIDIDLLKERREMLFVEALEAYQDGLRIYPTRDEEKLYFEPEQRLRLIGEGWEELVKIYLADSSEDVRLKNFFTANDLLQNAIGLERHKIDDRQTARVGRVMSKIGWERIREPKGMRRWGYVRPEDQRDTSVIFPVMSSAVDYDD